jgi:hypothetical protein
LEALLSRSMIFSPYFLFIRKVISSFSDFFSCDLISDLLTS